MLWCSLCRDLFQQVLHCGLNGNWIIHSYCLFDLDPEVSSLTSCHQLLEVLGPSPWLPMPSLEFSNCSKVSTAVEHCLRIWFEHDSRWTGFSRGCQMSSFFFPKRSKELWYMAFPHSLSIFSTLALLWYLIAFLELGAQWIVMDRPAWRCHNYWNFCGHFWHFPWSWPWVGSWLRSLDESRRPMTYENERPWGMLWYAWVVNGLSSHAVGTKFNS